MNRYNLNTSTRIVLSLIITSIATGYTVEASQADIQQRLISNAPADNPFNNQQQQPQPVDPIITVTPDANTSAINIPILNIGQPAQNLSAQANNTATAETTSNRANQINSLPSLPVGGVQVAPQVSIPTITAPVVNAPPIQQIAAQQPIFNNAAPVAVAVPIIPIISADPTPEISSSASGSLQTLLAPTINTAVESTTPAIPAVQAAVEKNTPADLSSRIKQLYSSMQNAQNQAFDETTYANFGASLVNTFNEAVEIQSYMIQLLNAAESTPLLNAAQKNYIRQTMLPNLDQIDESTKPLTHVGKSAPAGGAKHSTPASSKKKAKKKKGKKAITKDAAGSTLAPAGKKKSKKGASTNTDTTGTVTVVPVNTPAHDGATPGKKKKKKKGKKSVSATESNAISVEAPVVTVP